MDARQNESFSSLGRIMGLKGRAEEKSPNDVVYDEGWGASTEKGAGVVNDDKGGWGTAKNKELSSNVNSNEPSGMRRVVSMGTMALGDMLLRGRGGEEDDEDSIDMKMKSRLDNDKEPQPAAKPMARPKSFANLIMCLGEEGEEENKQDEEEKMNESLKSVDLYKMARESAVKPKSRRASVEMFLGLAAPSKEEQMLDELRKREADRKARLQKAAEAKRKEMAEMEQQLQQQSLERLQQRSNVKQVGATNIQDQRRWASGSALDALRIEDDNDNKNGGNKKGRLRQGTMEQFNLKRPTPTRKAAGTPRAKAGCGRRITVANALSPIVQARSDAAEVAASKRPQPQQQPGRRLPKHAGLDLYKEGKIEASHGEWEEALSYYHDAIKLQRRANGDNHINCGNILNDIGVALRKIGELYGAKTALEEALYIRQVNLGVGAAEVAETTTNIWLVLNDVQRQQDEGGCDGDDRSEGGGDDFGRTDEDDGMADDGRGVRAPPMAAFDLSRDMGGTNGRVIGVGVSDNDPDTFPLRTIEFEQEG